MLRRSAVAALIVLPLACTRPPSPLHTPPNTAAGRMLGSWLRAFDTGDSTVIDSFETRYASLPNTAAQLHLSRQTGGYDLVSIERSEPRLVEFIAKERNRAVAAYGILALSPQDPPRVASLAMQRLGPEAAVGGISIDAAERARVVHGAIVQLDDFYVFPDVAHRMDDSLRARLRRGAYDSYTNGVSYAYELGRELRDVGHDLHLRMAYSFDPLPAQPRGGRGGPSPAQLAGLKRQMDTRKCGFVEARPLERNIGYLKFNAFVDPTLCGDIASYVMTSLARRSALIVDLRDNGGGSPAMVTLIASYLFDDSIHLNDLWNRSTGETTQFWTSPHAPGRHFGSRKPVYVLTSSRTFSGAEEFSYDLQAQKRATIVGETTGGGAHPVAGRRIDDHFMIGVPGARAINPVTHTNWEGVGVIPDVKVPADDALVVAERLAGAARH